MKNNALSKTAFAMVLIAIVSTLAMIAFSEGIRDVEWMNLESRVAPMNDDTEGVRSLCQDS